MILYFSGTGNSLAVARKIAEALKERQYRHPDIKLKDLIKR